MISYTRNYIVKDQRKFRSELTALENELSDKEEKLQAAISTRQEFAGQLVVAQKRELAIISDHSRLVKAQVSMILRVSDIAHDYRTGINTNMFTQIKK